MKRAGIDGVLNVIENTRLIFETVLLEKSPPDDERTSRLIYWCKRFHKLSLVPESAGNLSFRTKQGFVITGTGINLWAIEKGGLVEILKVEIEKGQTLVYAKGQVLPSRE
ncbi:class II aldolase/adducin family protein, partial [Chloroflexota bacterium]